MHCPKCETETRIVETFNDVDEMHRIRLCPACKFRFLTREEEVPYGLVTQLRKFKNAKLKARKESHATTKSPSSR